MIYEYWLASIRPFVDWKKKRLREEYGSARAVYYIEETALDSMDFLKEKEIDMIKKAKKQTNLEQKWEQLKKKNIRFVPYFSDHYPSRLRNISNPPYALFVLGNLPENDKISVAIVGARQCSTYGESMALEYGQCLAEAGVQIISGMARGIDGAGQRGAMNVEGNTYGVLGCGVDICYPREHIGLYVDIQEHGGLLSEQVPGEPPLPAYFPERNRIISGLSDVVLVMEAKEKSGSLITADLALEQGKDVYALPGPVTSPLSKGCHHLIRQGAGILLSPEDLLEELKMEGGKNRQKIDENEKVLESPENMVYSCLDLFPKGIDQLIGETHLSVQELLERLITLEIKGYVKEISKGYYVRVR